MFLRYVRERIGHILLFILVLSVFTLYMVLCRMPVEAAIYPLCVSLLLIAAFGAADYTRLLSRHRDLCRMKTVERAGNAEMPEMKTVIESDLCGIIDVLRENEKRLEAEKDESVRDTTDYFTVWAHQIKTPIASMRLALADEDTDLSRRLNAELTRTEHYVDMVLTFLRLGSDTTDFVFREYPVDGILKRSVKRFGSDFISKKLRLVYGGTDIRIVTDEKWFSFVIEQIISNALKYTREGEVRIRVEEPGILYVEDTGIGIAESDLPRIFENGYTGRNGRADEHSSGIGLYLCKRICDRLGMRISASSEAGKGTCVRVDFAQKVTDHRE